MTDRPGNAHDIPDQSTHRAGVDMPLSLLLAQEHALPPNPARALHQASHLPGLRPAPMKGHGIEFEDLREYSSGDDIRYIDWNVTARTQRLHTRLYREERDRTITLALDLRHTMFTGLTGLRAEAATRIGTAMLWQAMREGDRVAVLILDADGLHATRPRHATPGMLAACNLIATRYARALPEADGYKPAPASEPPLTLLLERLAGADRLAGHTLLCSGFDDLLLPVASTSVASTTGTVRPDSNASLDRALAIIGHRRHATVLWVRDPYEQQAIPAGRYQVADATGHRAHTLLLDNEKRKKLATLLEAQRHVILACLRTHAMPAIECTSTSDAAALFSRLQQYRVF